MALTILDVLSNADYNINSGFKPQIESGYRQLNNAVDLLTKGYLPSDDFNVIMGDCNDAADVRSSTASNKTRRGDNDASV